MHPLHCRWGRTWGSHERFGVGGYRLCWWYCRGDGAGVAGAGVADGPVRFQIRRCQLQVKDDPRWTVSWCFGRCYMCPDHSGGDAVATWHPCLHRCLGEDPVYP
jgi:hypothetical protein